MIYLIAPYFHLETELYKNSSVEYCLEYFRDKEFVSVDTETQGRDPHSKKILSLQLGDTENQFVIDLRHTSILHFKELLESKCCLLHNAKFDYKFLKKAGITLEHIYDTMLAECVIFAGYESHGYGLDKLAKRYLNIELDKSTRGDFFRLESEPFNEYQIQYAARDVAHLIQIREAQMGLIQLFNLTYCVNLENEVVKALADIEYNGMILNKEKWLNIAQNNQEEIEQITASLDQIVLNEPTLKKYRIGAQIDIFGEVGRGVGVNWASPTQVLDILQILGIPVENTSDRELQKNLSTHPILPLLQDFREKAKILSTYGKSFLDYINPHTGRVHTSFWQIVSTGRVSSGSKDDNAPNLQNIPGSNTFRNCFEAPEGWKWISCDYSGK